MSKLGASRFTHARSKVISPEFGDSEKERTFVVLSLPRYFLLIFLCSAGERKLIDRSYFLPKIFSFIDTKGKLGSLPFVVFFIVQSSVPTIVLTSSSTLDYNLCFAELEKLLVVLSASETLEGSVLCLEL